MNNIKRLRKEKDLSVTELAAKLNMSQGNLTKIENGQIDLKTEVAEKIAAVLDVSVQDLLNSTSCPVGIVEFSLLNPEQLNLRTQRLSVPATMISGNLANPALYVVEDDTMAPLAHKGSLVLIEKGIPNNISDGLYVIQTENRLLFRRIQQKLDNSLNILSEHHAYPPQSVSAEKITIVGRACGDFSYRSL